MCYCYIKTKLISLKKPAFRAGKCEALGRVGMWKFNKLWPDTVCVLTQETERQP